MPLLVQGGDLAAWRLAPVEWHSGARAALAAAQAGIDSSHRECALPDLPANMQSPRGGPGWLVDARRAAEARFADCDLPTAAEEIWRYSRIDELDLSAYAPVTPPSPGARDHPEVPEALASLLEAVGPPAALAVVRDGELAIAAGDDPAVRVEGPGDEAWPMGEIAGEPDAFVTLNAAMTPTPLRVSVGKSARPGSTVVVINWVGTDGAASFPRLLVRIDEAADASVLEITASGDVASLVVPVTELDVRAGARLRYTNVQLLGPRVSQVGLQSSRAARDATLVSASVALGGDYARVRTDSRLVEPGASGRLLAVWFGSGRQMPDLRTVQDHRAPKTTSELVFKGAVANEAHSVYTGVIRVEKGANGTNAMQTNRNLVLHEGAQADSVPNLEIEDNDVRCSHASAVGPVDDDQRFYLESRGVPPETADRLIVMGFLDDVLSQVPVPGLAGWLRVEFARRLEVATAGNPSGEAI